MLNTLALQMIVLNFLIFGDPLFVNLVPRPFSQKHDLETEKYFMKYIIMKKLKAYVNYTFMTRDGRNSSANLKDFAFNPDLYP